jgi:hypothetical protein
MQSGWPDTGVGDTIVNASMKFFIHGIGNRWISIICGDDSVTVTVDTELERLGGVQGIKDRYTLLGMEVTARSTSDPCEVEFCSAVFMQVGHLPCGMPDYILFPKMGKIFSRLGWDMVDRNSLGQKQWLQAIADTLVNFGHFDPLSASLSKTIKTRCGQVRALDLRKSEYERFFDYTRAPSEHEILTYYHVNYGLSAGDIDSLSAYLCSCSLGELTHPVLERMAKADAVA